MASRLRYGTAKIPRRIGKRLIIVVTLKRFVFARLERRFNMEINQLTIGAELNHLSRVAQGKEPEVIDPADSLSYDYLQPSLMRLIENLETVYQADRSY